MKMLKARSQERLRRPQGAVEVANLRKRHPRQAKAWRVAAAGGVAAGQRLDSTPLDSWHRYLQQLQAGVNTYLAI